MNLPLFNFDRGTPQDPRSWGWLFREANKWLLRGRDRVYARDQRFSNQISSANKQSTQSVNPLSATDLGGGEAEIQIAAHSVQFGFGTVDYNAGTIGPLDNSTVYYVYVDDPHYQGGAVSYSQTQNANLVTGNSGRYYVGKVTTPAGGGGGTSGGWGGGGGGGGSQIP